MCTIITCLYLTLQISAMDHLGQPAPYQYLQQDYRAHYRDQYRSTVVSVPRYREHDITNRNGPVGTIAIGTEVSLASWVSLGAELRHQSFMDTGRDHGENTAGVFLKFKPWSK